jgi:alkylhydroperoxidase/carboxymuconolactone decarboxylase family protein YurZ
MTDAHPPIPTPVCDHLRATGGWNPNWDPFYQLDPAWTERFVALGITPMMTGALDSKTIELISIAVNASVPSLHAAGVRRHIRKALDHGATRQEIMAVLQLVSTLGMHSMGLGAPILLEELAARGGAKVAEQP